MKTHPLYEDQEQEEGRPDQPEIAPGSSPISKLLMNHIRLNYQPATHVRDSLNLTTQELYERLQRFNPHLDFGPDWLANELLAMGYQVADMGELRFVWLMKEA